jgi:hypothetical protein
MADEAMDETEDGRAHRDVKAELDERRIARGVALGLPLVTAVLTLVTGVTMGAPLAILVMASGILLGVIALFWASLRILSGDAALSPELEALDATAHAVDALASRKKMLVRALKDLENERALGKLEEDDFEQLSHTYRGELKEVLTRIDASLEPHRPKAEDAARTYLAKAGLAEEGYRGTPPREEDEAPESEESEPVVAKKAAKTAETKTEKKTEKKADDATKVSATTAPVTRVECKKCQTSNEVDASFCKKCGGSLAKDEVEGEA